MKPKIVWHKSPNRSGTDLIFRTSFLASVEQKGIPFVIEDQPTRVVCLKHYPDALHLFGHTRGNFPRTFHYKESYLPGYHYIDKLGYSGWAELALKWSPKWVTSTPEDVEQFFQQLRKQYVDTGITKYEQQKEEVPGEEFVFLPLQVTKDTVASLSYINTSKLLLEVANRVSRILPVVVKRHPRCKDEGVQHLISKLQQEGKITVTKAPVHDILRKAKLVITVNSGVGFEALLHLLPVITTGGSEYHWVTRVVKKPTDLPKVLSWQPDPDLIKKFLYYYHNQYVYFQTDKDRFSSLLTSWGF